MNSTKRYIPDSWVLSNVGEVYEVIGGGTPSTKVSEYWKGSIPWITSADIVGVRDIKVSRFISDDAILNSTTNKVPAGSLLVVTRVGLGKIAIADQPICFSQDLQALIQSKELLCPEFTLYFLNYELQILKFEGRGTTISGLTKKQLKDLSFPLPPLNEQKRIVAKIEELFSELDAGVAALKQAREKLKVYRQAVLKAAFEGRFTEAWRKEHADELESADELLERIKAEREARYQERLAEWRQQVADWVAAGKPGKKPKKPRKPKELPPLTPEELAELPALPEGWAWVRFGTVVSDFKRGPFGSAIKKEFFVPSGVKVYEQKNAIYKSHTLGSYFISVGKFHELSQFEVGPGDYIVSCSGTVGKIYRLPKEAEQGVINQALLRIRLLGDFLAHGYFINYFEALFFQHLILKDAKGTAMVNLAGVKELEQVPFAVPSINEQHQIVQEIESRFSVVEKMEQTIEESLKKAEALRQAILKCAFEGRLVPQDPNDEPASELLARIRAERETRKPGPRARKKQAAVK